MSDFKKRLTEVDEILSYLNDKEYEKIPKDVIQAIKENKDEEYIWKYDTTKKLEEQNLSVDTVAILSYLNMEYLLNDEEKEVMEQIHQMNEEKAEKKKAEKYKDELFKEKSKKENSHEEFQLVTNTQEKGFFFRILEKIRNLFKRKTKI